MRRSFTLYPRPGSADISHDAVSVFVEASDPDVGGDTTTSNLLLLAIPVLNILDRSFSNMFRIVS